MTRVADTQPFTNPARLRPRSRNARKTRDRVFAVVCMLAATASVATLAVLLYSIFSQGLGHLDWAFIKGVPSRNADEAGIWPAMIGTVLICAVCMLTAIPIGVATAILLEEYKPRHRLLQCGHAFIQLNITNLAGVPSIVYGILGLTAFVQVFGLAGTPNDPAFEVGVAWYDRFVTEGHEAVRVSVDGRDAPLTDPSKAVAFETDEGEPAQVRLVSREAVAPELEAQELALDAFNDALEERFDAAGGIEKLGPEQISAAVDAAWRDAGLKSEPDAVKPQVVDALTRAAMLEGRERRRAMRQATEAVESAEADVRFAGVLLTDAVPSRLSETQPWYLRLPFGRGVLAGGLTLMLVILPIVIISSQEALRAVPRSVRQASVALGATPWQTVRKITLPSAMPGIMTGVILATSRAIGEAAPILVIAGIVYITFTPSHLMDDFTAMPLQVFNWASRPQQEFHALAAAGILLLLAILLVFNGLAIFIRQRTQQK